MKKKSKKSWHNKVIAVSLIIVFICLLAMNQWYSESRTAEKEISELESIVFADDNGTTESADSSTESETPQIKDCVAWVKIPDTDINYPVMQKDGSPEYYLRQNYKGEYSYSGTPFLDSRCNIGTSQNLIIYGHNMRDGKMFSDLLDYKKTAFCQEYRTIYLTVDGTTAEYELFTVCKVKSDDEWYGYSDQTDEETFYNLISHIKSKSLYESPIEAEYGDHFITLSTCDYSQTDGRFILIAKGK